MSVAGVQAEPLYLSTCPFVAVAAFTEPILIAFNLVLSLADIEPAADVVAAKRLIAGVAPPDETIGAVPVTKLTPELPLPEEPLVAPVILPCASTVMFALV